MKSLVKNIVAIIIMIICMVGISNAQTEAAYHETKDEKQSKLFNKDRLTVNHALSFGMSSSSNTSGLMSQSLYATMLKYQFSKPVTVEVSFGLPIHNTYDPLASLNSDNIQSADYFRNIPFDASITWQPTERFMMNFSIIRDASNGPSLFRDGYHNRSIFDNDFMRTQSAKQEKDEKKER